MKRGDLVVSPVYFEPDFHTYTLNGKQLSGVTGILSKMLFADKYKGVSKEVLDRAKNRGSLVHAQVQHIIDNKLRGMSLMTYLEECEPEIRAYIKLIKERKIKMIASEYLVSDEIFIASSIDIVDENLNLYDIKTTSTLDTEYVRWQLSIYAYLFEKQNSHLAVGKLFAVHLRENEAKIVEVQRISNEVISELLWCWEEGEDFTNPLNNLGDDEDEILRMYKSIVEAKKEADKAEKDLKATILSRMQSVGTSSIKKSGYKISLAPDTTTKKFDENAFAAAHPAIYKKFLVDSVTKGRLTITFSKNETTAKDTQG